MLARAKAKAKKKAVKQTCRTVTTRRKGKTTKKKVCKPVKVTAPKPKVSKPKAITGTGANVAEATAGAAIAQPLAASAPAPATVVKGTPTTPTPASVPDPAPSGTAPAASAPSAAPPAPAPSDATPSSGAPSDGAASGGAPPSDATPGDSAPSDPLPEPAVTADEARVERLLWRAGFGPRPGERAALAGRDYGEVVRSLTRVSGTATLTGPAPVDDSGKALQPAVLSGHDHVAWLDRMIRTDQPFVERMALIWHDWFATSFEGAGAQHQLMLDQVELFRQKGRGTFDELLAGVTQDPAMLLWLNSVSSTKANVNENFARELMELFTLGPDRGAYTETDVREAARALTGFTATFTSNSGWGSFRYDAARHDAGAKTIFGQTGNHDWQDVLRLCLEHPQHASFFCRKLWSYFVPTAPDAATLARLSDIYTNSGRRILPVVEAILQHADFLDGPEMMIPPVVYNAGLMRATGVYVDTIQWTWYSLLHGQRLYYPPDVCGWDDDHWLNTSTVRGRWLVAAMVMYKRYVNPYAIPYYDGAETPEAAVAKAMDFLGQPSISGAALQVALDYARTAASTSTNARIRGQEHAMRQNGLRLLIATSPDFNVC